jgi:NADH dehydrogenase
VSAARGTSGPRRTAIAGADVVDVVLVGSRGAVEVVVVTTVVVDVAVVVVVVVVAREVVEVVVEVLEAEGASPPRSAARIAATTRTAPAASDPAMRALEVHRRIGTNLTLTMAPAGVRHQGRWSSCASIHEVARPHVVIVGAGFGGLDCAKQLVNEPVDVTIVDRHNFHTFQPLLYQVATAGLASSDVAYPVRGIFQDAANVRFRTGTVTGVDFDAKHLALSDGATIPYDTLVLALGATTNFFGVEGAAEHAFPLYGLQDAIRLRNHVIAQFERADSDPSLLDRGALTFVVLGGGPTGVEMAGALTELFGMVFAKDFRRLDVGAARVVLVEMTDAVLAPFSARAQRHAREELQHRGVEVRLGERVTSVGPDTVTLASGEVLKTGTVVWAAGVRANPIADALGVEQVRGGRIKVGRDLRIAEQPDTFVIGDLAAIEGPGGVLLPQVAQVAKQSGHYVGKQIARSLRGRSTKPFRYFDKGTMATIGRNAAVADLPLRIRLTGFVAWVAWLFLHLLYLVGFRNRLSVLVSWGWSYLTWDRGPRLILESDATARARPSDT